MLKKYFSSTQKFYYSLFFILPFLVAYEVGLARGALGHGMNGADAILRLFYYFIYDVVGKTAMGILVAASIISLLAYFIVYLVSHRIKIRWSYFILMFAESLILALIAGIILHLALSLRLPDLFTFRPNPAIVQQLAITGLADPWSRVVAAVGAGIFEEFLFRVVMIRFFYMFWKSGNSYIFGSDRGALNKAVLVSSVIFALVHLGSVASPFGLISIFLGSLVFSQIYLRRGYGIAAGTHIMYDLYLMFGIVA